MMKNLLVFVAILVGSLANSPDEELHVKWNQFKKIHQKSYNALEEIKRKHIFDENVKKIEGHNRLYDEHKVTYKMAINQFADLTREEFGQHLNRLQKAIVRSFSISQQKIKSEVPDEINWSKLGAVTEVKNQGQCGSAGIFTVIGALESANFIKHGLLISLSDQELMDCLAGSCNGGFIEDSFEYVLQHGLAAAKDYPDEDAVGTCRRGDIPSAVVEESYEFLPSGSEDDLKAAVGTIGPVAAEVDATGWQFYSSGIFSDSECSATLLNHAVLVVGYGEENGIDFWLGKNSWGTAWGENGYIRTIRNDNNNCGIATHAIYPVVA